MKPYIVATSELTGTKVENLEGKHVGEIEDIMFDPENGTIAYAVLSFGGFLGIGDKHFAIPVEALGFSDRRSAITLDIDKKKLENAPGFDKSNRPIHTDTEFIHSIYDHYGYERRTPPGPTLT